VVAVKKVHRYVPDVAQGVADRGTEIVERHLSAYGVTRAMDLPEEGKVHLKRELEGFFTHEYPDGLPLLDPSDVGVRGALKRCWVGLRRPFRRDQQRGRA
jgi:hypothetical protein